MVFPLKVAGTRFADATGAPVHLLGAILVDKAFGWPGSNGRGLDVLSQAGANWTHIRMGPHGPGSPDSDYQPDVALNEGPAAASWAFSAGIALEVDVIDGWVMKHSNEAPRFSFYNWDCNTTQGRPTREQLEWATRVATAFRGHPNVMFQTSNEGFDCPPWGGSKVDWEVGIRDAIRAAAPGHLIGTNSQGSKIERYFDYVNHHGEFAEGATNGRPLMINETGSLSPEEWETQARAARAMGTSFHWWCNESEAVCKDGLERLRRIVQ